jgi:nucleotide-binding universal stress UspA family protein
MTIKQILVPVDLSEPSIQALDYAIELAAFFKAKLTIVFVAEPLYYAGDLGLFIEEQQRLGREQLTHLEERVRKGGRSCETLLLRGAPYQAITDAARRRAADLIVMGTHGRTGLSHLVMGSVADRVVRTAPCPVLTVPPRRTGAKRRRITNREP